MILLDIPYKPTPWAAPKLSRNLCYDIREEDKRAIRFLIQQAFVGYNIEPLDVPVSLEFIFYFEPPSSFSTKKKEKYIKYNVPHKVKPDVSNCVKLTEDCLQKIVITNDSHVVKLTAQKKWSAKSHIFIKIIPFSSLDT